MKISTKDATITNTDADAEAFPGTFEVVLSTPSKDRDGDTLATSEWKMPLPDHITFDIDHGMSVEKTVGSGVPAIDEQGRLVVKGAYSSLKHAQDTRTLVNEGHIRTVSVAFLTEPSTTKDGVKTVQRELLNGAFVAIPANPDAVVLSSKSATSEISLDDAVAVIVKAGARNSASDQSKLQEAHDALTALGAECAPADAKSASTPEHEHEPIRTADETKSKTEAPISEKASDADLITLKLRALQLVAAASSV